MRNDGEKIALVRGLMQRAMREMERKMAQSEVEALQLTDAERDAAELRAWERLLTNTK